MTASGYEINQLSERPSFAIDIIVYKNPATHFVMRLIKPIKIKPQKIHSQIPNLQTVKISISNLKIQKKKLRRRLVYL